MSNLTIALWTLGWLCIAFVLYRYLFNPQIVVPATLSSASKCPERWTFRSNLCYPDYDTRCIPFDPLKLKDMQEACQIAKNCGTDWSSMCL